MDGLVERHGHFDGLGRFVGRVVLGSRDDPYRGNRRADGIHPVGAIRRQGHETPRDGSARRVFDRTARQGIRRDTYAVFVDVPFPHDVPERQRGSAAPRHEGRVARAASNEHC